MPFYDGAVKRLVVRCVGRIRRGAFALRNRQQKSKWPHRLEYRDADPIEPPADRRPKGRRYADDKKRADAGAEADPVLGRGWAVKPGRTKKPEQPEAGSDDKPRRARAGGPSRDYESSDEAPYRPRRAGGEGQARAGRKQEAAADKTGSGSCFEK